MLEKLPDPRFTRSRQALVSAMTDLIDERNLEDITITDLVGRASVTRPTFYQHFRDIPAIARHASVVRLEAAFPPEPCLDRDRTDAERAAEIELTVFDLLNHLHDHIDFYRRVIRGASAMELYDDLVRLLETRIIHSSPLGPKIQRSTAIPPQDRATMLAGGLTWLIIRWLHSDFTGNDALPTMAKRVAAAMIVFA